MNTVSEAPLGKRARARIERPKEILAAALDEFYSKGFSAARVEDIASEVGVTKGTVYFYFETKEELFAQAVRSFSPSPEELLETIDKKSAVWPQLEKLLANLFNLVAKDPISQRVFHLLISEGRHFPKLLDEYFEEFLMPVMKFLSSLLDYGVETGEFRRESLPLLELLFAPTILANTWLTVFGERKELDVERLFADANEMLFRSIRIQR